MLRDSPPLLGTAALALVLLAVVGPPAGAASVGTAADGTASTFDAESATENASTATTTATPTATTSATTATTATSADGTEPASTTAREETGGSEGSDGSDGARTTSTTVSATSTTTARTATPEPAASPSPTTPRSDTATPTSGTSAADDDPVFVVDDLSAPERYRLGGSVAVTATVTNRGPDPGTERVNYSFGGVTADSTAVTLRPGESTTVRFELGADELTAAYGEVTPRTYVHGVRNESGSGVARRLRATPDTDLAVVGFDAPTDISREEPFVVLATVENPGESAITREVTYRFESAVVAERAVTVAAGDRRQVAFEVGGDAIADAAGGIENGTAYYHAVGTTGGDRQGGSVRVVRGPRADADALAVEGFETTGDVRPGGTVGVNVTLRNVAASDFEGQLSYRLDGSVVATEWVGVPTGERETVAFRVDYGTIERAAVPFSDRETSHGVWIGDDAVRTRPVTVQGPMATETPTTATPEATFSPTRAGGGSAAPTGDSPNGSGGGADGAAGCSRGLVTKCGGTVVDETTLTVLGTLASVFGIVFQLARGD